MIKQLKAEIQELAVAMTRNGFELRRMIRIGNTREQLNLMAARTELLKSICHKQGKLIEALEVEAEYGTQVAA